MKDLHLIIEERFYESLMNFLRMLGFSSVVALVASQVHKNFIIPKRERKKIENNKKPFKFQQIKP